MSTLIDHTLLRTKINAPAVKDGLVNRTRLLRKIATGLKGRLTAVCAPAGYGKTTLLGQSVRESTHATAWVSLDELDNDPVKFWRYTATALAEALPAEALRRSLPLAKALPNVSIHAFLDTLSNELYASEAPIVLVLDDYHAITDDRIHQSLAYFIDYLPPHAHVAITSRTELPFPTSKWMAREELTEVSASELQFTLDELEVYSAGALDHSLSRRHQIKLLERTEGWVTGLQMAFISMRLKPNPERFIDEFKGYNERVSEFLFEEVFEKLPVDVQQFLLKVSVADRLDAEIGDAVAERTDSHLMLAKLKAQNLFVVPLDEQGEWVRFHHLFSQFLRSWLRRTDPEAWLEAHRRAGQSFASRGLLGEAIDHAITAQDFALAERLLERHIATAFGQGEFATLMRWFGSLPGSTARPPEMTLLFAFILAITGQLEWMEAELGRVQSQLEAVSDEESRRQINSGLLFVKLNGLFFSGRFDRWHAVAEGLNDDLREMMTENKIFYNFNFNSTEPFVRRTAMGLKGMLSPEMNALGLRFLQVLNKHGWNDSFIGLYVRQSMCEGLYEKNRMDDGKAMLREVEKSVNTLRIPGLFVPMRIMQARYHIAEGKYYLAHDTVDEALEIAEAFAEPYWDSYLRACKAHVYLAEDRVAEAKKELAALRLSDKDKPTFSREFEYLTFVRLLMRQRKLSQALRLLELLKPQAEREALLSSMAEITILQALAEQQAKRRANAFRYLREALAIGEENDYARSFVDEGQAMAELLESYLNDKIRNGGFEEGESASEAYVRKLIGLFPDQERAGAASKSSASVEPLTESEAAMLQLIRDGASNREIAKELALSEGTVKVYLSRLYGKLGVSSRTQALNKARNLTEI
ncbi:LuxR C-terminal-related transcriptional regulator [Cohnella yongneupensis]|uniref:LuxR C-terminal-related transcriptional regulator n=1 Tax=Cohnella yongneupensis TaxID=425006 RepID=A0ABW0QU57_9BACL